MEPISELDLYNEKESIKYKIDFETEKAKRAKSLYQRLDSFISKLIAQSMILIISFFFIVALLYSMLIEVHHLTGDFLLEFLITMAILSLLVIFDLYRKLKKVPISILDEYSLNYIKEIPFLTNSFRKYLNKDDTLKCIFKDNVKVYINNINNDIDKLNERLKKIEKDIEKLRLQHLSNMAKSI